MLVAKEAVKQIIRIFYIIVFYDPSSNTCTANSLSLENFKKSPLYILRSPILVFYGLYALHPSARFSNAKYALATDTFVTTLFSIRALIHALIWPSFEYQYFRWDIRDDDLIVQQGVLFRQWVVIPGHRITR